MNQVDRRDKINAENVSKNLKHDVAVEIPFDRESVKLSINKGEPLLSDGKTHPMTRPILELVGLVKERVLEMEKA